MINIKKQSENAVSKKMRAVHVCLGILVCGFFIGGTVLLYHFLPGMGITPGVGMALLMMHCMDWLSVAMDRKTGSYRCKECGHTYVPSFKNLRKAVIKDSEKLMLCPQCREQTAHTKINNQ